MSAARDRPDRFKSKQPRALSIITDDIYQLMDDDTLNSAIDISMTSTIPLHRVMEPLTSEAIELPQTRSRAKKAVKAYRIWTPGQADESPDVEVLDECWSEEHNLGLMLKDDGTLEDYRNCSTTAHKPSSCIAQTGSCMARVWISRKDPLAEMDFNVHRGTAVHIGNGYFLTAAHVLHFPGLDFRDAPGQCGPSSITELEMHLVRPATGTDTPCGLGVKSTYSMRFTIMAFTTRVMAERLEWHPDYAKLLDHWDSNRMTGLMPLPIGYTPPKGSDIALIRVVPEDRRMVKSAFVLPGSFETMKSDTTAFWCGINAPMKQVDLDHFPSLGKDTQFVNGEVLRASRVSYFKMAKSRIAVETQAVPGSLSARLHTSKGSSGSGLFAETPKKETGRLLAISQYDLRPAHRPQEARVVFASWSQAEVREFIKSEIVPRFRRPGRWERRIFRQSNKISEAWDDVVRE